MGHSDQMGGVIQSGATLSRFGDLNIRSLVDVLHLQRIQDHLAKATGVALITVDYRGVPVTEASSFIDFCTMLRADPEQRRKCFSCDAHGGLHAAISGKPSFYVCHMGLVDFAVPIMLGELYLGAVMGGQVQIEPAERAKLQPVMPSDQDVLVTSPELVAAFERAPHIGHEKIVATSEMIFETINYFVRNEYLKVAVEKRDRPDSAQHIPASRHGMIPSQPPDLRAHELAEDSRSALKRALEADSLPRTVEIITFFLDEVYTEADPQANQAAISALESAIVGVTEEISAKLGWELHQGVLRRHAGRQKIENRYDAQCYLEELAFQLHDFISDRLGKKRRGLGDLLNLLERHRNRPLMTSHEAATYLSVSASYFSKHFKEATGTNYVTYVTLKRVERAKMMLAHTDMKVSTIANELGFQPNNYFTRVFRKITGQTPREYRYLKRSLTDQLASRLAS